jgi:hypothetical protein
MSGPDPLPRPQTPAWRNGPLFDGGTTALGHKKVEVWTKEQFEAVGVLAGTMLGLAPMLALVGGPAAATAFAQAATKALEAAAGAPKWTVAELKAEWQKTARGREILANLPPDTKFMAYEKRPGDQENAYYDPNDKTIYIPASYTSAEAAPTAAHEAVHADQHINHGRPTDFADKIEMEVEAKNAGLDVYDQLGQPALPYNYKTESDARAADQAAYDAWVRQIYTDYYLNL